MRPLILSACVFAACNTPLPTPDRLGLAPAFESASLAVPGSSAPELIELAGESIAVLAEVPAAIEVEPEPADELLPGAWIDELLAQRAPALEASARAAIADQLVRAEGELEIDPLLILAVMAQESRFDPSARGPRGSLGLMQVRPFVGRDIAQRNGLVWDGPKTLLDPARNAELGIVYLAEMVGMFADIELALAAYNMGPYRLRRMLSRGGEPRGSYSGRVFTHYAELTALALEIDPDICPTDFC